MNRSTSREEAPAGDTPGSTRHGRLVLVTGASSGIGLGCARAFLEAGDRVVCQYHSQSEPIAPLAKEFGDERVQAVGVDLSREEGCVDLVRACGEPQVLVHSAGIWNDGAIHTLTAARLEEMFRLNTFSAYYLAREMVRAHGDVVPTGAVSGSPELIGNIVLIGSTAGERGEPGHSHYAGSKAALWGLVQSLAQELAPAFRVNLISPGWVRTPMANTALAEPGREAAVTAGIPLARIGEVEDLAAAAIFLADDSTARHLTGVDLPVSGGALLPIRRG